MINSQGPRAHFASRPSELLQGARDTVALLVGAMPSGVVFGALAIAGGLSSVAAQGMSLFVFAGSAQFFATGLLAQSAVVTVIVLTIGLGMGVFLALQWWLTP